MNEKFEIVEYDHLPYLNIFVNRIKYRSPHFHPALEIGLVLEGEGEFVIAGQILSLHQGDLVMLNQNQLHSIRALGDDQARPIGKFSAGDPSGQSRSDASDGNGSGNRSDGCLMLFIQFSLGMFKNIMPNAQSLTFDQAYLEEATHKEEAAAIRSLMIELAWRYNEQDLPGRMSLLSLFFALLKEVLTHFAHHFMSTMEEQNTLTYVNRINRLVTFVEENFRSRINLSDFAEKEGLTLSYMSRFVKENFGQNFQSYVTDYRFRHAKNLLAYENKNMLDACYESGFSDPRFMAKAFREKLGLTPEEYRKSLEAKRELQKHHVEPPDPETEEYRYGAEESLALISELRPAKKILGEILAR